MVIQSFYGTGGSECVSVCSVVSVEHVSERLCALCTGFGRTDNEAILSQRFPWGDGQVGDVCVDLLI